MSKIFEKHIPVLKDEVANTFAYLAKRKEPVFVDGTIGLAGHSLAIAKQVTRYEIRDTNKLPHRQSPERRSQSASWTSTSSVESQTNSKFLIVGIDKDEKAIEESKLRIKKEGLTNNFVFVNDDFSNYDHIIHSMNIDYISGILLDLGVSSMQLDEKERGFSFQEPNQPLDMRMDQKQLLSAATIVNNYSLLELKRVLKYAEEKYFKYIAENICQARKVRKIRTVGDLLKVLEDSIPAGVRARSKKHFATNTFRGLRIETNNELSILADTIKTMVKSLKPGGRIAIISFHSTEDRIVKHALKELADPCTCPRRFPQCVCGLEAEIKILTKKPIEADENELKMNARARSAKLRIAEKISN